jgi:peptide-methionine (R)-S-oxide reductase
MTDDATDLSDEEWRERLDEDEYHVLRERGTEPKFSGDHLDRKADGVYACAGCGATLFDSDTKFGSGTGWPSFYDAVDHGSTGNQTTSGDAVDHGSTGNQTTSGDAVDHGSTGNQTTSGDAAAGGVELETDTRHGMRRTEVLCATCGGHLGHVFEDGPDPTGKRYCINSVALDFEPED